MAKPHKRRQETSVPLQPIPSGSLLDATKHEFTPDLVHRASSMIGEPEAATRRALDQSATSLCNRLRQEASSVEGARVLEDLLRDDRYRASGRNIPSLFGGGNTTANTLAAGKELLAVIFGNKISSAVDEVAAGGVASSSAEKLLALVGPLILALLWKRARGKDLNASQIADLLGGPIRDADAAIAPPPAQRGPVPVPKRRPQAIESRESTLEPAREGPSLETTTEEPATTSHRVRNILFIVAAVIALALLILLLVRGPAHRSSILPAAPAAAAGLHPTTSELEARAVTAKSTKS